MDANIIIGLASFVFTAVGSIAAIIAIRRHDLPKPRTIVGTVDPKPALRLLGRRVRPSHAEAAALRILARFVFVNHDGPVTVGALDQFEISLFLDLFSAATYVEYRQKLARLIAGHIRATPFHERPMQIAVPKEGNVLLADAVAQELELSLVVVRTMVPAIRFGDPVEGMLLAGACVVIVDDIASDGELLVRTVGHIRTHGGRVSSCFCAVERMDGNSRERLAQHGVELHAPIQLDEGTLRGLAHLPPERDLDLDPSAKADD